jgi:hypothetical protein
MERAKDLDAALRDWATAPEMIEQLILDPELLRRALTRLAEEPALIADLSPQLQQFFVSVLAGA